MLHQIVNESQATAFSAQRAIAYPGKVGVEVEAVALEDGHHALVLHLAILHDGLEDEPPVGIHVLKAVPGDGLQKLGDGKHGTRVEPAADVVVTDVVEEGLGRHGKEDVLQFLQVLDPCNLLARLRIAEDEVSEAEILHHRAPQVNVHLLRILVDEGSSVFGGVGGILRLAGLDDEGHEGVFLADGGAQLDATQPVLRSALCLGEAHVGNDSQQVVFIFLVNAVGLFIGTGQDNLGAASHTQGALVGIQGFGTELLALLKDKLVEVGQDGGVEAYLVLHQQDDLHTHLIDIVLQVHLVLDQFDDGHQQVRIAQPAEDVLESTEVFVGHPLAHPVTERSQDDDGNLRIVLLDAAGGVEDFRLARAGHADDQVVGERRQLL